MQYPQSSIQLDGLKTGSGPVACGGGTSVGFVYGHGSGAFGIFCACVCWHLMLLPAQNAEAALGRSQVLKGLNPQAELAEALLQP